MIEKQDTAKHQSIREDAPRAAERVSVEPASESDRDRLRRPGGSRRKAVDQSVVSKIEPAAWLRAIAEFDSGSKAETRYGRTGLTQCSRASDLPIERTTGFTLRINLQDGQSTRPHRAA
jgi:hypothetical protein